MIFLKIIRDYVRYYLFYFWRKPTAFSRKPYTLYSKKKIRTWQGRQKLITPTKQSGVIDMKKAQEIHSWVLKNIKYESDEIQWHVKEHWPTSVEVLQRSRDDCVANYEEIYTKEGIKKVGDLIVGDNVLSYDFGNKDFCYKKIVNIWEKGILPLKRVKTMKGNNIRSVDVTSNTKFMVRTCRSNNPKYEERLLSDINTKNGIMRKIPIAKKVPYLINDIEWLNEDLCFVIGHFIAEGWKSGARVQTSGYDCCIITDILKKNNIPFSENKNGNGVPQVSFLNSKFKIYLRSIKSNSFDIHIPEEIFHLPKNKLKSLLDGYFLGDGHEHKRGYIEKYYSTSSDQLASDVVRIHLQLGLPINGYLQEDHQGLGNSPIWRLYSTDRAVTFRDYGYNDLSETSITNIEDIKEYECRDFEIEDTHIFFFKNGIMCHNCDGIAVAHWILLRQAGFADDDIGIVITKNHAFCCIQEQDDFWMLDNGYLTTKIMRASKFFPNKKGVPLVGLNPFDIWNY